MSTELRGETSQELYEAFVKLLHSDGEITRYQVIIALMGFDYEQPDFIEEAEKQLSAEKVPALRGMLKQFLEKAKGRRDNPEPEL
jgi:hypothetical protein